METDVEQIECPMCGSYSISIIAQSDGIINPITHCECIDCRYKFTI